MRELQAGKRAAAALERSLDKARSELAAQQLQASREAQSHRELLVAFDKYKARARPAVTCIDQTQGEGRGGSISEIHRTCTAVLLASFALPIRVLLNV